MRGEILPSLNRRGYVLWYNTYHTISSQNIRTSLTRSKTPGLIEAFRPGGEKVREYLIDPIPRYSKTAYVHQSQRPSFHPVLHLSSHLEQSNSGFPSFLLTSLCAPHNHMPKSCLLPARISSFLMYCCRSSAHTQHGYSFENSLMKLVRSDCSDCVGAVG